MTAALAGPDADSQLAGFAFAVVLLDPCALVEAGPDAADLLHRSVHRLVA